MRGPGTTYSDKPFVPEIDYLGDPLLDWGGGTGHLITGDVAAGSPATHALMVGATRSADE